MVSLVIFFFFSKPIFAEIDALQDETIQFEEAAARASELNSELSNKLTEKRSYPAEALERLEMLAPDTIDEVKILSDVHEIARKHNLLFGNVSLMKDDGTQLTDDMVHAEPIRVFTYDDLVTAEFAFSLIGSYDQFKAFLSDVEQSLLMFEITHIEFTSGEGLLQQYNMTAQVFALPPIE